MTAIEGVGALSFLRVGRDKVVKYFPLFCFLF